MSKREEQVMNKEYNKYDEFGFFNPFSVNHEKQESCTDVLDTHVGSGSSLIACHNTHHNYIGFEIDPVYYEKAKERIDEEKAQINIFDILT